MVIDIIAIAVGMSLGVAAFIDALKKFDRTSYSTWPTDIANCDGWMDFPLASAPGRCHHHDSPYCLRARI
jgi:hypothetical protein